MHRSLRELNPKEFRNLFLNCAASLMSYKPEGLEAPRASVDGRSVPNGTHNSRMNERSGQLHRSHRVAQKAVLWLWAPRTFLLQAICDQTDSKRKISAIL